MYNQIVARTFLSQYFALSGDKYDIASNQTLLMSVGQDIIFRKIIYVEVLSLSDFCLVITYQPRREEKEETFFQKSARFNKKKIVHFMEYLNPL